MAMKIQLVRLSIHLVLLRLASVYAQDGIINMAGDDSIGHIIDVQAEDKVNASVVTDSLYETITSSNSVISPAETQTSSIDMTTDYVRNENESSWSTLDSTSSILNSTTPSSITTMVEVITEAGAQSTNASELHCVALVCVDLCKYGYVFDDEGCQTCECDCPKKVSCPLVLCDYEFVVDDYRCITCQCKKSSGSRITSAAPAIVVLLVSALKALMH